MTRAASSMGGLLGGKLHYEQPLRGYRTGIEPVFLAASLRLDPGTRILEAGCGAGAGLLCAGWRAKGAQMVGVEIDPLLAAMATRNLAANGLAGSIECADFLEAENAGSSSGQFDAAFANPPWHDPRATPSPDAMRARARIAVEGVIAGFVAGLCTALRPGGMAAVIVPPARQAEVIAAFQQAGAGDAEWRLLLPRAGKAAKLGILRAVKGAEWRLTEPEPFIMHEGTAYSAQAEAVLRDGAALL